ncbi:MAG: hypothetical protein QM765_53195 [Myxococcales bacterium]
MLLFRRNEENPEIALPGLPLPPKPATPAKAPASHRPARRGRAYGSRQRK